MEPKPQQPQFDEAQQKSKNEVTSEAVEQQEQTSEEVVPGVPIVRSNTPRPLSYEMMISSGGQYQGIAQQDSAPIPTFPAKAPSAPPVPEEFGERVPEKSLISSATTGQVKSAEDTQEFIWLFEYGLEMDAAILNSPERLAGMALLYGPAVLKGYSLIVGAQRIHGSTGPTIVAISPSQEPDAEVWGVLYRIPRRLSEPTEDDPSLLDTIHAAIVPQKFFKGVPVVVYETYRERELTSVTYVATEMAYQQLHFALAEHGTDDQAFMHRLATIAQKQKLPEHYIQSCLQQRQSGERESVDNEALIGQHSIRMSATNSSLEERALHQHSSPGQYTLRSSESADRRSSQISEVRSSHIPPSMLPLPASEMALNNEHNTEPLPAFKERLLPSSELVPRPFISQPSPSAQRWFIAFAVYLVCLLLLVLIFAVIQGLGVVNTIFNNNFTPLGVPWLVMTYGLLGGCISCILTLGRLQVDRPPTFIVITWFTRPFIGSILAVLSYILLTSGMFAWSQQGNGNIAFFSLVGALAGLCEGRVFFHRS
ncbi:gamma-glutamylcyclotransferase family protein [Dictyobacter alpinus]|nr:gamma-glutamylcyclotransferase family protein [Dictyobacter alpinus]